MRTPDARTVVARWKTTEIALGAVLAHVAALRTQSLAEPGCLGYEAFQSVHDPTTLTLIESYRDQDALEAHRDSAHYQRIVGGQILPLLIDRNLDYLQPATTEDLP